MHSCVVYRSAEADTIAILYKLGGNLEGVIVHADDNVTRLSVGVIPFSINQQGVIVGTGATGTASGDATRRKLWHAVIFRSSGIIDLNSVVDWNDADRKKNLVLGGAFVVGDDGRILADAYDGKRWAGEYILVPEGSE